MMMVLVQYGGPLFRGDWSVELTIQQQGQIGRCQNPQLFLCPFCHCHFQEKCPQRSHRPYPRPPEMFLLVVAGASLLDDSSQLCSPMGVVVAC